MRVWPQLIFLVLLLALLPVPADAETCPPPVAAPSEAASKNAKPTAAITPLGVSRVVEIDTSTGALFGDMTKYQREDSFLGPKEVVLTFDDGPLPWITKSILDTLDRYCTKATFFAVGQMALAYPAYVKDIMARGHTLGTHTWSHPMNIGRLGFEQGKDQIEKGIAAIALAAGQPIAPFFRFPGLNDSDPLLSYLQSRGIASFTVDVVSNDSYTADPGRLTQRVIHATEQRNGGILLFHDIKASTAKALPEILRQLQERGFKVVHMRAKAPVVPLASYEPQLSATLAKTMASNGTKNAGNDAGKSKSAELHQLLPADSAAAGGTGTQVSAAATASTTTAPDQLPVTAVSPPARTRLTVAVNTGGTKSSRKHRASNDSDTSVSLLETATKPPPRQRVKLQRPAKKSVEPQQKGGLIFPF